MATRLTSEINGTTGEDVHDRGGYLIIQPDLQSHHKFLVRTRLVEHAGMHDRCLAVMISNKESSIESCIQMGVGIPLGCPIGVRSIDSPTPLADHAS